MEFVEFRYRIMKITKNYYVFFHNHKNNKKKKQHRIPCHNNANHENLVIPFQNYEKHEVHKIPLPKSRKS